MSARLLIECWNFDSHFSRVAIAASVAMAMTIGTSLAGDGDKVARIDPAGADAKARDAQPAATPGSNQDIRQTQFVNSIKNRHALTVVRARSDLRDRPGKRASISKSPSTTTRQNQQAALSQARSDRSVDGERHVHAGGSHRRRRQHPYNQDLSGAALMRSNGT